MADMTTDLGKHRKKLKMIAPRLYSVPVQKDPEHCYQILNWNVKVRQRLTARYEEQESGKNETTDRAQSKNRSDWYRESEIRYHINVSRLAIRQNRIQSHAMCLGTYGFVEFSSKTNKSASAICQKVYAYSPTCWS